MRPAGDEPPQAERSIGSRREIRIEWDQGSGWCRSVRTIDQHHGHTTVAVADNQIIAAGAVAFKCRCHADAAGIPEVLWRRRDENNTGIEMRQPDQRSVIRRKIWIDGEIATPNAERAPRRGYLLVSSHERLPGIRAGNQDCGAETPMRVPQVQGR